MILAQEDVATGEILWHLADHQGTVRDLLDNTGTVVEHIQYDAFGKPISVTDAQTGASLAEASTRYLYTGREWDADVDLYYYRARWYDPRTGRFVSQDPIGLASGDVNFYRYVGNSPPNFTDPTGLVTFSIGVSADLSFLILHFAAAAEVSVGYSAKDGITIGVGCTLGGGPGLGIGAGAGADVSGTTAPNVGSLAGNATEVGVEVPIGGASYTETDSYKGITVAPGPSPVLGVFVDSTESFVVNTGPDPEPGVGRVPTEPCGDGRQYLNQGP